MNNRYKELLQGQYNSFINLDERGFFLGLADYVKFIIETPLLSEIVKNIILPQYKKDTAEFRNLKEKAEQELKQSREKLLKEVFTAILPTIKEIIEEPQKDKMESLKSPLDVIHDPALAEYMLSIWDKVYKNIENITPQQAEKIISLTNSFKKKFILSQTCIKYYREKSLQKDLREVSVWGSWYELKLVYDLIHQRRKIAQEIEEGKDIPNSVGIMFLSGEMDTILKRRPLLPIFRKFDVSWSSFSKDNYIVHLNRVHNYLIGQIGMVEIKEIKKEEQIKTIPSKTFEIRTNDRYIWINDYLLSKPFAVGSNLEFFQYIRSKSPKTLITRDKMPNVGDRLPFGFTKEAIEKKSFIKIINELGFKGEILKAFFHKRSKDTLMYMGDKITEEDLHKAGIKFPLFIKELELANAKNSPE